MTDPRCGRLTRDDVEAMLTEGYSTAEIAERAGIKARSVQGFLSDWGLSGRQRPRGHLVAAGVA